MGQANRAGDGPDRCDGLGVVPVRATGASAIAGPAATAATINVIVQGAVHRQRRDRARGHGADVLLREPRQMLQEAAQIQRIPE